MTQGDVFDFNPTWNVKLTVTHIIENDKGGLLELDVVVGSKTEFEYSIQQLRNTIIYSSIHGMLNLFTDNKWKSIPEKSSFSIPPGIVYRLRNPSETPITFHMKIEPMHHFAQIIRLLYGFATLADLRYSRKKYFVELLTEFYQTDFEFAN